MSRIANNPPYQYMTYGEGLFNDLQASKIIIQTTLAVGGSVTVDGAATFRGTLNVSGPTYLTDLYVLGNTNIGGGGGIIPPFTLSGLTDSVPFTIDGIQNQTSHLQSWKVNGVEKAYVDKDGNVFSNGQQLGVGGGASWEDLGVAVSATQPVDPVTYEQWVATKTGHWAWIQIPQASLINISPSVASMPLSGLAPTVSLLNQIISVGVGSVALAGLTPTYTLVSAGDTIITPATGPIVLTGNTPTYSVYNQFITVTPSTGSVALAGLTPTYSLVSTGGAAAYRSAGTLVNGNVSLNVPWPSGISLGDLLLGWFSYSDGNVPNGWTPLFNGGNLNPIIAWKIADATSGSTGFNAGNDGSGEDPQTCSGEIIAFYNTPSVSPFFNNDTVTKPVSVTTTTTVNTFTTIPTGSLYGAIIALSVNDIPTVGGGFNTMQPNLTQGLHLGFVASSSPSPTAGTFTWATNASGYTFAFVIKGT